jgi:hypothetical protein
MALPTPFAVHRRFDREPALPGILMQNRSTPGSMSPDQRKCERFVAFLIALSDDGTKRTEEQGFLASIFIPRVLEVVAAAGCRGSRVGCWDGHGEHQPGTAKATMAHQIPDLVEPLKRQVHQSGVLGDPDPVLAPGPAPVAHLQVRQLPVVCRSIAKVSKVRSLHLPPRAGRALDLRKCRSRALFMYPVGYPNGGA